MFEIIDGKLYQWDTDRKIKVSVEENVEKYNAEFVTCENGTVNGEIVERADDYFIVKIPNELLQLTKPLHVYITFYSENGERTTEEKILQIKERTKPTDYDANVMFGDTIDEILGEVIEGGLADKLACLKECLDILYQSPPIKLMREVAKDNTKLKELCEYISNQENNIYSNLFSTDLKYVESTYKSGFERESPVAIAPNGETYLLNGVGNYFIANNIYFYPDYEIERFPYVLGFGFVRSDGDFYYQDCELLDFRNIEFNVHNVFEYMKLEAALKFNAMARVFYAIWLPKVSCLNERTIHWDDIKYPAIKKGLHIGRIVVYCDSEWIFADQYIDVQNVDETPVYCDKDFLGDVYLEKFNIPIDCILTLLDNLTDLTVSDWGSCEISIGEFNIEKINKEIDNGNMEAKRILDNVFEKGWDLS